MLVRNAVGLLSRHGTVAYDRGAYHAVVGQGVITFVGRAGRVSRLRLSREGQGTWAPRSITAAIRHALTRGRAFPVTLGSGRGLLVSAAIDRRGHNFAPVACFIVMDLSGGPTHLQGAADEFDDDEAVQMAGDAIDGRLSANTLVNWLAERGGRVAVLVQECP